MPKKQARVSDGISQTVVELELEGFPPSDSDRGGIIRLLSHIFVSGTQLDIGEIADLVIRNDKVGSVIRQVDDEEEDYPDDEDDSVVFALVTAIDISKTTVNSVGVITIRRFIFDLLNLADACDAKVGVSDLLMDPNVRVCLLINERLETLPLSVCANAVEILPSELKEANMYPTHIVMIFRAYESEDANHSLDYFYEEFKHIEPFSLHTLTVHNTSREGDAECNNIHTILVISMDKFKDVLEALKAHV